ncbi:MAG: hypothetical protein ABJD07_01725 [Gemmatimonadaceae bacterium]
MASNESEQRTPSSRRLSARARWSQRSRAKGVRRGGALLLMLFLSMSIAALALSAIFLTSSSKFLGAQLDREEIDSYGADAALQLGKSRLELDPTAFPDSGWAYLLQNATIPDASNNPIPGVLVNVYVGPTGSVDVNSGGRFATLFAEVSDVNGGKTVRRLELVQESFARFGYWSNSEGSPHICFGSGDHLYGPVFSNDTITTCAGQAATFHDSVVSVRSVVNYAGANGIFMRGFRENAKPISLPTFTQLNTLIPHAASGQLSITAANIGPLSQIATRLEFVTTDLNADGDSTDANEGFVRIYQSTTANAAWVRGDWSAQNCGVWFKSPPDGAPGFYPDAVRALPWVRTMLLAERAAGDLLLSPEKIDSITGTVGGWNMARYMKEPGARCYLGGDPRLAPVARTGASAQKPGRDSTFTAVDPLGSWVAFPLAVSGSLVAVRPNDAAYLYPLSSSLNPGWQGVIYADGTIGVSGRLRGKVTLYTAGNIGVLADLKYQTDPASNLCADIMGMISLLNIMITDNAIHVPQLADLTINGNPSPASWTYKSMDDTPDAYVQSTVMALGTSFGAQNPTTGADSVLLCGSAHFGRGCLYLTGSIIHKTRATVNGSATNRGYAKRYSFDRCAVSSPPPFFPTTGRFLENRYFEVDRGRFNDVNAAFRALSPRP